MTRKEINLPKSFFMNYVRASARSSLQYFICLNSKRVKIYIYIFGSEKCKITFGFKYINMDIRLKLCIQFVTFTNHAREEDISHYVAFGCDITSCDKNC